MKAKTAEVLLAASTLLLGLGCVFAGHPKVARDLEGKDTNSTVDVIVQYQTATNEAQAEKVASRGGRLKSNPGLAHRGRVRWSACHIAAGAVEELANDGCATQK